MGCENQWSTGPCCPCLRSSGSTVYLRVPGITRLIEETLTKQGTWRRLDQTATVVLCDLKSVKPFCYSPSYATRHMTLATGPKYWFKWPLSNANKKVQTLARQDLWKHKVSSPKSKQMWVMLSDRSPCSPSWQEFENWISKKKTPTKTTLVLYSQIPNGWAQTYFLWVGVFKLLDHSCLVI